VDHESAVLDQFAGLKDAVPVEEPEPDEDTEADAEGAGAAKPAKVAKKKPAKAAKAKKSSGKKPAKPTPTVDEWMDEVSEVVPAGLPDNPLDEAEWDVFTDSLVLISELMDDLEGYLGLDTSPETGIPLWALERFEADAITKSYRALAQKRPKLYQAARAVNMVAVHSKAAVIVGSRVIQAVLRHMAEGIHLRLDWHQQRREGVRT